MALFNNIQPLERERVTEEAVTLSPGILIRLDHLRHLVAATRDMDPRAEVYAERTTPKIGRPNSVWLDTLVVKTRTPLEEETSDE